MSHDQANENLVRSNDMENSCFLCVDTTTQTTSGHAARICCPSRALKRTPRTSRCANCLPACCSMCTIAGAWQACVLAMLSCARAVHHRPMACAAPSVSAHASKLSVRRLGKRDTRCATLGLRLGLGWAGTTQGVPPRHRPPQGSVPGPGCSGCHVSDGRRAAPT